MKRKILFKLSLVIESDVWSGRNNLWKLKKLLTNKREKSIMKESNNCAQKIWQKTEDERVVDERVMQIASPQAFVFDCNP